MPSASPDGPELGQLSCSTVSVLLRRVRQVLGERGVEDLLRDARVPYSASFLEDSANWIWYDEVVELMKTAAALTGDERIARRIGEETVRQHTGTAIATYLRSLGSPENVFEQLTLTATKFSTVVELTPVSVAPGRAVVRKRAHADFQRHRHLCELTAGMLSQPPVLFGLPPAVVEETRCELRGDDHCCYEVSWDAARAAAAADPQELITALEAQVVEMSRRLESMYATARELVALDDIDSALARIAERVATEVRAPKYLLAVRFGPAGELHVHSRGYDEDEVEAAAIELLDDTSVDDDGAGGSLVAEIVASGHRFGKLMASSRPGGFFPQERDLIEVYGSYAATIMETATALDDARRQHARAHALLGLSQATAVASTSDEVSQKLADALPQVVDCDRVAVMLWNEDDKALHVSAVSDQSPERRALLVGHKVRPADTPHLARQIESPDPAPDFYLPDSEDELVRRIMAKTGAVALAVVPIVGQGRFHGVLNVSVLERPSRLMPNPDLLDRLAGVAAQAATALDNARLIERMAHQARHDNLTNLLGHRAFHEAVEELVEADEPFSLATIDLDDFKKINDSFGHPVGDKALRKVAAAMLAAVRTADTVFRVGGEEFAVLLPGLPALDAVPVAERMRRSVAAASFDPSLSISIGLAGYPDDADSKAGLIEKADVALYAAKRSGKDRTIVC